EAEHEAIALRTNELDEEAFDAVQREEDGEQLTRAERPAGAEPPQDREHDERESDLVQLRRVDRHDGVVRNVRGDRVAQTAQVAGRRRWRPALREHDAERAVGVATVIVADEKAAQPSD